MCADESSVRVEVSRAAIPSVINRARHPQSLVESMTEECARLLVFDDCALILPESDGRGIRVWQASRRASVGVSAAAFEQSDVLFARVLHDGSSRLMSEGDLQGVGRDVRSALALPLAVGGVCFGVLCFASTETGAHSREDADRPAWLAARGWAGAAGGVL